MKDKEACFRISSFSSVFDEEVRTVYDFDQNILEDNWLIFLKITVRNFKQNIIYLILSEHFTYFMYNLENNLKYKKQC